MGLLILSAVMVVVDHHKESRKLRQTAVDKIHEAMIRDGTKVMEAFQKEKLRLLKKYLDDTHAPPLEVTMWPSTNPWRTIANVIVCVGLLFWVWLPVQIVVFLSRWLRA